MSSKISQCKGYFPLIEKSRAKKKVGLNPTCSTSKKVADRF